MIKKIDAKMLLNMFVEGSNLIRDNFEYINELNVFPVPDGDTGTNMKITILNALETTKTKLAEDFLLYDFGVYFCRQLLMNARGNSGVILSQIIKGFFEPIKQEDKFIDINKFKNCLVMAKEKSYKSVSNPIEGTILTIIRIVSEEIADFKADNLTELIKEVVRISFEALKKTPDMLPSLKEAKVVDSGGYGLCKMFEGFYNAITNTTSKDNADNIKNEKKVKEITSLSKLTYIQNATRTNISEEGFGYCCEFIIQFDFKTINDQKDKLNWNQISFESELLEFGDSLVIVVDDDIVKLHMHTTEPYKFLKVGQKYGEFLKIKIENMTLQFLETHPQIKEKDLFKQFAISDEIKVLITAPTESIGEFFKSEFHIDMYLNIEKTGNPSTSDFIDAIKKIRSKNVLLVIDDSNIFLSAQQSVEFLKDKFNIKIVKASNIIESMFACMNFDKNNNVDINSRIMNKIIKKNYSAAISTSTKSLVFKDVIVRKDDFIGIINKKIVCAEKDEIKVVYQLIDILMGYKSKKTKFFYAIYGENVKVKYLASVEKYINENYGIKCILINGKQNIYSYFLGIY